MLNPLNPASQLPRNSTVHLRLRWHRGLLGLPLLTPEVVVEAKRQRR